MTAFHRLLNSFRRRRLQDEIDEEVRFHLDMRSRGYEESGIPPQEARTMALRRFGGELQARERTRDVHLLSWLEDVRQDVVFGFRLLRREPTLTLTAILTLTLGIGGNAAVFSVVNGVLFAPLPYPDSGRLVAVYDTQPSFPTAPASFPEYVDWRNQNRVFESIGGYEVTSSVLAGQGEPERLHTARVTASLFRVYGVAPALGRWFAEEEDTPGGARVVILTDGLWKRRFGADPRVIGRTIRLNDVPRTVVGVMPPGFAIAEAEAEAFTPLARALDERERGTHSLWTFARLEPGTTAERAQREMVGLGHRLAREHGTRHGIDVRSLLEVTSGEARTPLLMLLGSVSLVLLIACTNVANLLLSRAAVRRREIAVRRALGAGRLRLVRQFIAESLLLSAAGGALGLLLAWVAVEAFVGAAPAFVPRLSSIEVDGTVLAFTCGVALLTGLVFGLSPALYLGGGGPAEALKGDGSRTPGRPAARLAGRVLVVAEIALSLVLAVGAGLMLKSLVRLGAQDLGFVPERVIAFDVALPATRYGNAEATRTYFVEALRRLAAVPGATAVGITSGLPLYGYGFNGDFQVDGRAPWSPHDAPLAEFRIVGGDYFAAMRMRVVAGRAFDQRDDSRGRRVAIVNERLARRCWPGESAIGKRIAALEEGWREVVGVIADVRSYTPGEAPELEISIPFEQFPIPMVTFAVRAMQVEPSALLDGIRHEMSAVDAAVPLSKVQTIEEVLADSLTRPRILSILVGAFALLAGLLAIVGIYGLVAYTVAQRTQEFGIRMAMGADSRDVTRLVVRDGLRLAGLGLGAGLVAALGLTRLIRSMLYQVEPHDPVVLAVACAMAFTTAVLACYLPARRAAGVNPMAALRAE